MLKLGVGYESYKRIIDDGCYYVDKTSMIRDIVEKGGMVTLFTRPRRFGKTLALSMLQTFFEEEYDRDGNPVDKSHYFAGLRIMEAGDRILNMMGKYPVIMLSLKSAKQTSFRLAFLKLRDEIVNEIRRHDYLFSSGRLSPEEKKELSKLNQPVDEREIVSDQELSREVGVYSTALKLLSSCLEKHHGMKTIILLDEYDVTLENAFYSKFYDEMVGFIRSLFESCLKTNNALEFAVITGCLRISRESIFTGLNHLVINSIREEQFAEGFGFTPQETDIMLETYGLSDKRSEVQDWYNGYIFGEKEIFNPWSVIQYIYSHLENKDRPAEPYWPNTSSNQIIKDLVERSDEKTKNELDILIRGGTIEKQIHNDITYEDIYKTNDNLWNFLYFTGYLKKISERSSGNSFYLTMKIPNREIAYIYENQIREWFDRIIKDADHEALYRAVLSEDTDGMEAYMNGLLAKTISTFDSDEGFYHGFFLSLLYGVPHYTPQSNREEGIGRPDITLYPDRPKDPVIIFEVKTRKKFSEMQDGLEEAFRQIRDKKYREGVVSDGYIGAVSYGICFCKKNCVIEKMI